MCVKVVAVAVEVEILVVVVVVQIPCCTRSRLMKTSNQTHFHESTPCLFATHSNFSDWKFELFHRVMHRYSCVIKPRTL